jgi:hypothetical protein
MSTWPLAGHQQHLVQLLAGEGVAPRPVHLAHQFQERHALEHARAAVLLERQHHMGQGVEVGDGQDFGPGRIQSLQG